jgi:hypothetical protein
MLRMLRIPAGKLCTICDQPLQEIYVGTGRITYPGCRAKTGGER